MSSVGAILHGPSLEPAKPPARGAHYRPTTWTLGARMQAPMVDAIERLARVKGCKPADILRTAMAEFLARNALAEPDSNLMDPTPSHAHQQPRTAQPYKGTGGSDQNSIRQSTARTEARKANQTTGERLIDKAPSR